MVRRPLPSLEAGVSRFEEQKEGDTVQAPRWQLEVLEELGFSELVEEPFDLELFKAVGRERMAGPTQLIPLPGEHFYQRLRRRLQILRKGGEATRQAYHKMRILAMDLVTIRVSKIMSAASMTEPGQDFLGRLAPEEQALFKKVHAEVSRWKRAATGEEM